jgi:hypothetical protein
MKSIRSWSLVCGALIVASVPALAGPGQTTTIEERARGANRIVVARIAEARSQFERTEHGDELIVTYAQLDVEEVLKGEPGPAMLAFEGGTVHGVTMRVSSMPSLAKGDRAVFFLTPGRHGEFHAHLKGEGILKLTSEDRVAGSSLTLGDIRRSARAAGR